MATGNRLLSQVMTDTYRCGYTYKTKIRKCWRNDIKPRPQTEAKRMGSKILRKALKNSLSKELKEYEE